MSLNGSLWKRGGRSEQRNNGIDANDDGGHNCVWKDYTKTKPGRLEASISGR